MDLFLLLAILVPVWLVAIVFFYLEVRDAIRYYRGRRRFHKLIDSMDLTEPQGRPRLGLRQEEE